MFVDFILGGIVGLLESTKNSSRKGKDELDGTKCFSCMKYKKHLTDQCEGCGKFTKYEPYRKEKRNDG